MRVVINAQLDPDKSGGIAQVVLGLAHALGRLEGPEEYRFVCSPRSAEWIKPHLGANTDLRINRNCRPAPTSGIRRSDGFWESFEGDVLHFPYQSFTATNVPSVFNPHDLQHIHLPECFTSQERERRGRLYDEACRAASLVAVTSRWVEQDLARHLHIPREKIRVIPWAPPTTIHGAEPDCASAAILDKYALRPGYLIYPAQTWPHKNHVMLLKALKLLHDRNPGVHLVCPGTQTDHYPVIQDEVRALDLQDTVHFLGRVSDVELIGLYRSARLLVVPTMFEAASFPIFEAFHLGLPVACSNVTSLPEQVGDAAIIFDPRQPKMIAQAMTQILDDPTLAGQLAEKGRQRCEAFTWSRTAMSYRELYRELAGVRKDQPVACPRH